MTTPYLAATEISALQKDQYATSNELDRVLEQAIAGRITIDFPSDANHTLVTTAGSEEWRDKFITFTDVAVPLTADRDVVFPANGPLYIVTNSTGFTLTLKITGQTGATIADGVTAAYYYNGTDMAAL